MGGIPKKKSDIIPKRPDKHVFIRTLERVHTADRSTISWWIKGYIEEESAIIPKRYTGNSFATLHVNKILLKLEIKNVWYKKGY